MRELDGRVAVVTGASSGIGRALASELGRQGMHVALADIDADLLGEATEEVARTGATAVGIPTDVADPEAVEALAASVLAKFGAAHVVCNNAGVSRMGYSWEMPLADWQWVMNINFWGIVHGIRSFVPHLIRQPEGHIINTASIGGLIPAPHIGAYTAAKHAVIGVSRSLRLELAERAPHIGVGVLCPGSVATGIDPHTPRPDDGPEDLPPAAASLAAHARSARDEGLNPAEVAQMALRNIREGGFYLLPNIGDFLPLLRADFDEVLAAPVE